MIPAVLTRHRRTLPLGLLCTSLMLPLCLHAQPMGARGGDFLYQVTQGDTLEQLARRYTLQPRNWEILQSLNQVDDPYALQIAKVLRIPLSLIPRQAASATVIHMTGQVFRDGQPLQRGDMLQAGQTLHSASAGTGTLQLEDGSLLTLEPGTSLHIQHLQRFQGSGLTDTILQIKQGSLNSIVAPEDTGVGRFEVRTPATVTGVRGTQLRVHVDQAGSRLEVLHGQAAIDGQAKVERQVATNLGTAYDAAGVLLGTRPLLPAPDLPAASAIQSNWHLSFPPVPKAHAYRIRIALDPAGARLESSRRTTQPTALLTARGGGQRYLFVSAIDSLGIEGRPASQPLFFPYGWTSSDGRPILSSDGAPVARGAI